MRHSLSPRERFEVRHRPRTHWRGRSICGRPSRRASCNSRAERRTRRRWRLAKCLEQSASRRSLLRGLGFHGRRNGVPASHRPSRLEARSGLRKRQAGFISPGEPPIPRVERQPAFIAGTRRTRRSGALRPIRPRGRSLPPARAAGRVHRSKNAGHDFAQAGDAPVSPSVDFIHQRTIEFFRRYLVP